MKIIRSRFLDKPTKSKLKKLADEVLRTMDSLGGNLHRNRVFLTTLTKRIKKSWGFKIKKHSGLSGYVAISKKYKIVMKIPYICSEVERPPKSVVPTVIVPFPKNISDSSMIFDSEVVLLQPLVDTSEKSYRSMCKKYNVVDSDELSGPKFGNDCHRCNVGVYKKQFVAIDW